MSQAACWFLGIQQIRTGLLPCGPYSFTREIDNREFQSRIIKLGLRKFRELWKQWGVAHTPGIKEDFLGGEIAKLWPKNASRNEKDGGKEQRKETGSSMCEVPETEDKISLITPKMASYSLVYASLPLLMLSLWTGLSFLFSFTGNIYIYFRIWIKYSVIKISWILCVELRSVSRIQFSHSGYNSWCLI